jgi:hypothetical protein
MTFDLGRLALSASIAILALVSSAVALEAPRASDKAALAACLNRDSPDGRRLKTNLHLFVVIGKPGSPRTRWRRV